MKKGISFIRFVSLIFLVTGCASIVSNSQWPVTISSNPSDVNISIRDTNGTEISNGKTPTTITLKSGAGYFKSAQYTIVFSKTGYEDQTVTLSCDLNEWYIGNIIFGGLIGFLIVDPLTGAMWKLPDNCSRTLSNKSSSLLINDPSVMIAAMNNTLPTGIIKKE